MIGSLVKERIGFGSEAVGREVAATSAAAPRPVASSGAADGYRAFIEVHVDEAYRLATFVTGNRMDGEDAVHDAAIAAWRHWDERRDPGRTEAWFRRIVVNASRDRVRAAKRVRPIVLEADAGEASHRVVPDHADRIGERDRIDRVLEAMSLDDRVLLSLRFGLDLTVPAIAAALDVREGTIKSRLHRATEVVRSALIALDEADR